MNESRGRCKLVLTALARCLSSLREHKRGVPKGSVPRYLLHTSTTVFIVTMQAEFIAYGDDVTPPFSGVISHNLLLTAGSLLQMYADDSHLLRCKQKVTETKR